MAEFLVIRLGANPAKSADWIVVDGNGARRSPPVTGPLAEAAKDVGDRSVIVLVPASSVLTTAVDIPIKAGARLRAALPYALEEQLADDIENLHFAAGQRSDDGLLTASVVAHSQMQEWISALDDAGIAATQVIPENHGLAKIPGTTRPDEVVIYMGHWDHFGTDPLLEGDQIFNGAVDNATGIAALIELAEAFKTLEPFVIP